MDNFLKEIIKGSEYCSKVIETEFNKPVFMTKAIMKIFKILQNVGVVKKHMNEVN